MQYQYINNKRKSDNENIFSAIYVCYVDDKRFRTGREHKHTITTPRGTSVNKTGGLVQSGQIADVVNVYKEVLLLGLMKCPSCMAANVATEARMVMGMTVQNVMGTAMNNRNPVALLARV